MTARLARVSVPAVALAAIGIIFAWHASNVQHWSSDTPALLHGVGVIDRCLHAGRWACGSAGYGDIGPSALLQYLPGLAMKRLGFTFTGALRGLAFLNSAAFLLVLVLLWRTGRRIADIRLASLLGLVAVTGPLFWYGSSGFGEGLGVLFVTMFTCAVVVRARGVALAVTLWFAAISKEPALPFLLAIAFVVLRQPSAGGGPRVSRSQAAGLAVGALAGLATNIAFNAFRSSTGGGGGGGGGLGGAAPLASSLRHIAAPAPTLAEKAEAAISLAVAPNVGLLWFWPVAVACLVLAIVVVAKQSRSLGAIAGSAPVGAIVVLALLTAGISSFVSPYGFGAWGPRYLVPWIPAFVLVALHRDWDPCRAVLDRLRQRRAAAFATIAAVMVLAASQLAAFLNPVRVYQHFGAGGACPTALSDITLWYSAYGEVTSYYRCTRYLAWTKGPLLVNVDAELAKPSSALYLVIYLAGVATLGGATLALRVTRLGTSASRDVAAQS